MDPPPIRQAPLPPVPRGMGCFAKGCLTLVVIVVVLGIVLIGGGLFVVNRGINTFTTTAPVQIQMPPTTPAELQLAKAKLDSLRSAIRNRLETTVAFTADDINALLQMNPNSVGHAITRGSPWPIPSCRLTSVHRSIRHNGAD